MEKIDIGELSRRISEPTYLMCKPECVLRQKHPYVLQRIYEMGLTTPMIKLIRFNDDSINAFYGEVIERMKGMNKEIDFTLMKEHPSLAVIVQGPNSLKSVRKAIGGYAVYSGNDPSEIVRYDASFEPTKIPSGGMRSRFSTEDRTLADLTGAPIHNFVHASDSYESFKREMSVLMDVGHIRREDIVPHKHLIWDTFYRGAQIIHPLDL